MCEQETFWTLLHNAAHWEFELFLMAIFDGLLFGLAWPYTKKYIRFARKHIQHHQCPPEKKDD